MPEDEISKIILDSKNELEILRQLHILAQTETLSIEKQDWDQLQKIVDAKEKLVLDLSNTEQRMVHLGGADLVSWGLFSQEQKDLMRKIKADSSDLIEKINLVEKRNLTLLEGIKSESIRASLQIQQYQQLLQSYLSMQDQPPQISQVVE